MTMTRRGLVASAAVTGTLALWQAEIVSAMAEAATPAKEPAVKDPAVKEPVVKGPVVKDQPLHQVSPHVFMIEAPDGFPTPENQGLMSNITFVVAKHGVVVVDSGASLQIAEMAIRQLRTLTRAPVVGIINTHYHGDHWLGNHGFVEAYGSGFPIYAHAGTRQAIEGNSGTFWHDSMLKWTSDATAGTRIVPPTMSVDNGFTIPLGDVTLRLHHYGQAHTHSDIAVEIVDDHVVCVGDIMMDRRIANMDDGSYKGTLNTIELLIKNCKPEAWVPAHGDAGMKVLEWHRSLFMGIYESCVTAVKQNIPLEGALAVALKDPRVSGKATETRGWEKNIGKYVSIAYLEAEQDLF